MESTLAMVNIETESKEIVKATNPSGVTRGGKDPAVVKDQVVVVSKSGYDEQLYKAKHSDNNSTASNPTSSDSERKS